MKYSAQYHVFSATFHVISRKIDFLWDSVLMYNNNKRTVDSRAKQLQLVCTATIIELQAAEPYSCRCGLYKLTINLPVRGSVLHLSHQPESSDDSLALRGNEKSCSINQLSSTPQLISLIYFIHILFSTTFQDEVTVFKKFDF